MSPSAFTFLSLFLAMSPVTVSSLAQRVNSQPEEAQTQIRNHLRHLVEDISKMVTYFEMDNSSVVVELARQVAQLRGDMAGLKDGMAEMREEMRTLSNRCGGLEPTETILPQPTTTLLRMPPNPTTSPCGDRLQPVSIEETPDGWAMCFIHIDSPHMRSATPQSCSDLLINLQHGYGNSAELLAAGGNFGCWRSSGGISGINPLRACNDDYQHNGVLQTCSHCDVMGICIRYP